MDESRDDRLRKQYRQLVNGSTIFDIDALRKLVLLDGLPTDANALNTLLFWAMFATWSDMEGATRGWLG